MSGTQNGPVTVAVSRRVRPGKDEEFTAWAAAIADCASRFPGHLGSGHIRAPHPHGEHTLVYRFDTQEHFDTWQASDERKRLVEQATAIVEGEARVERTTGLEFWFHDPTCPGDTPPVWKQALLTWFGLYPTVIVVSYTLGLLLEPLWLPARVVFTTGASVTLMTWLVMPNVTRWFRRWLHPGRA